MNDLAAKLRARVVETLRLAADEEMQRQYQATVPNVSVSDELFNQWDDWYHPSSDEFALAFDGAEREALRSFDRALAEVAAQTPQEMPALQTFVAAGEWRRIADAARAALEQLR